MGNSGPISNTAVEPKERPDKSFRTFIKNAFWAYKIMFRLSRRDSIILFGSSILSAAIPIVSSYLSARFIDEVIALVQSGTSSVYDLPFTSPIIVILLLVVAATFAERLTLRINEYVAERFEQYHFDLFNVALLSRISELDIVQFEDPSVSNDIRKARDNNYKIYVFASSSVTVFIDIITTVVSGIISFSVSPIISVLIVLLSIPNNLIYSRFIKAIWNYYNNRIEQNRTFWWISSILIDEQSMPEHKVTNSHRFISKYAMDLQNKLSSEGIQIRKHRFTGSMIASLLNSITYIVTPLFLISRIISGTMTIGQYTFIQGRFFDFSSTLDRMLGQILELTDSASYLTYVRRIFEIKPAISSGRKVITLNPKIEFKDVSFKYPRSQRYALRHVNLAIRPGEEVAIVGENGAGKTTLIKLILRFYQPTEGSILIDGIPIQEIDLETYRNLFGALFQEFNQYGPFSVKDNIAIGDRLAPVSMKKVRSAATQADAEAFIEKLELGYETKLAKQFKQGTNLSTGQWQKLALARMFYRDRPVLILDEPTASIDAEAEFRIFKRIYSFMQDKTVIIISHRFSTVRNAKQIYVLRKGEIVESGSHEQLIKNKGVYAHAFFLQAKGYQNKKG